MTDKATIEAKFWKALKSDMTLMLGLDGVDEGHAQPMTAQLDGESRSIYFFTSKDTDLAAALQGSHAAFGHFASKHHDLFATIHGELVIDNDRATIDRLWNRFVAAWYEGGKEDPKLLLLRLDADRAQVWLNESSLLAGVKIMLGRDPKQDYKDKVAEIRLQ
jgi:general stress protein 26